MAEAKISIGSVSITGHLVGILRRTDDLANIVATHDLFPTNNGNFEFTSIDPGMYRLEVRESSDGIALGTLIGPTYSIDVRSDQPATEYVMYTADGMDADDPVSGQSDIVDTYLDGKNIVGVFKEGFRFLELGSEYSLLPGGGVHIENGVTLAPGEVFQVLIGTIVAATTTTAGLFAGVLTIETDTTLDATYQNKKIKCKGTGTRLKLDLPPIAVMPEGKFFYFTTYTGNQYQTRFVTNGAEQIEGYGNEIVLGKNEFLWIEKRSSVWEVVDVHENVDKVGNCISCDFSHINTMPEDGRLLDGDDYPRIYDWITNVLPFNQKVSTTDALIAGYVADIAFRCLFIVASDSKKFRMPDKRGWSERGMASFSSWGDGDPTRLYNYPNGTQLWSVGPHRHDSGTTGNNAGQFLQGTSHNTLQWNVANNNAPTLSSTDINRDGSGGFPIENRVSNFGVIYSRLI